MRQDAVSYDSRPALGTRNRMTMDLADIRRRLRDNLAAVEERVQLACRRCNRSRADVTLVAVTKSVGADVAALLPELGVRALGESRPQELARKAAALSKEIRWHLIGHLQRNKVELVVPIACLIHSVDSRRLLEKLSIEGERIGRPVDVLLEVNLSREKSKHGFSPDDIPLNESPWPYPAVHALGLMTMAANVADPEQARATFAELRQLRDRIGTDLRELSMGMTNDFEVAIEEGATYIRIGSALFEGLEGHDASAGPAL
jgi:pyridoxal phosphate enzyme (YggS family)